MVKRYIRAFICISFSLIKFIVIKLFNGKSFISGYINMCSPMSEIENRKGYLQIGRMLKMRSFSHIRVRKNAECILGDNVSLNYGCMIVAHENIKIGSNVELAPNVLIYDHDHDFRHSDGLSANHFKTSPVVIGDNCWIGANTVILRGTILGDNCVVGAGSVISGKYPAGSVIVQKRTTTVVDFKGNLL